MKLGKLKNFVDTLIQNNASTVLAALTRMMKLRRVSCNQMYAMPVHAGLVYNNTQTHTHAHVHSHMLDIKCQSIC